MVNLDRISAFVIATKDDDGNDDFVTSLVCDQGSFDWVWDEIERCKLQSMPPRPPMDPKFLAKVRACKRIPFVCRTPKTEHIFAALGVTLTDKFTGIVRGASEIPLDLANEA